MRYKNNRIFKKTTAYSLIFQNLTAVPEQDSRKSLLIILGN